MKATSDGAVILGILAAGTLFGLFAALALAEVVGVRRGKLVIGCVLAAIAVAAVVYWSLLGYNAVAGRALSLPIA
jgi:hypothetical protein